MYLKEWAQSSPEKFKHKVANWVINKLFGLSHRHEIFLYHLYKKFYLNNKITVLDIGSGTGYALSYNNSNICKYAVDRDNYFENMFRENGINFIQYDIEKYDLTELATIIGKKVDLLIMNHVIEHIHYPDRLVAEIGNILKPGGIVYLTTPDIEKFKFDFYNDYSHVRPFTKASMHQLFKEKSFEILSVQNTSSLQKYVNAINIPQIFKILLQIGKISRDIELIAKYPVCSTHDTKTYE